MTAALSFPVLPAFTAPDAPAEPLAARVDHAVREAGPVPVALLSAAARDERDALLALLVLQGATTPSDGTRGTTPMISPILTALRGRLERDLVATLETRRTRRAGEPLSTVRVIANAAAVPDVYRWAASRATWRDLVAFLAVEHVTHATDAGEEHTGLPVAIATLPRTELPTDALRVLALDGMLVNGVRRDAERVGARAVAVLRRPARSRRVLAALRRLEAPASVLPYHSWHGQCDPRVAQRRVADEVTPLADSAETTQAVVRGARWRDAAERRLFAALAAQHVTA